MNLQSVVRVTTNLRKCSHPDQTDIFASKMGKASIKTMKQITTARQINAAVVNVSGRQRMLSQRIAFFSLKLVWSQDKREREKLRAELLDAIALMETSHNGLLNGDPSLKLPGNPSQVVRSLYFDPPLNLDQQIRDYISQARSLATTCDAELSIHHPCVNAIANAAEKQLLAALDTVVSQYQIESEAEQKALDINQIKLYKQSCSATVTAKARAKHLEKALQDLKQAQIQLIQSEKLSALGQLIAGIAHEINNPVTFIYGNLIHAQKYTQDLLNLLFLYQKCCPNPAIEVQEMQAMIDLEFVEEDLPKVMSSMTIGAERIREIVQSLRNFSRTDEAEIKIIHLHEGINNTLLILQSRLKAKADRPEIKVIQDYGDLPAIECYAGPLNQVFMNILSNAIDALEETFIEQKSAANHGNNRAMFLPENKHQSIPMIRIRTEMLHPDYVSVRITDNGPGISEAVQAKLFQPFFTTKPVGKGTGLGLSISYQIIVERHGGSLRCISTPGKGTEFVIDVPIRQSDREYATTAETA